MLLCVMVVYRKNDDMLHLEGLTADMKSETLERSLGYSYSNVLAMQCNNLRLQNQQLAVGSLEEYLSVLLTMNIVLCSLSGA